MTNGSTNTITLEPIPQWSVYSRRMISDPTISIDLTGLLAFCYNEDSEECEVGVHNASDHFLTVRVFENAHLVHSWTGHASTVRDESYSFRGSSALPGVRFFHPTENFDRGSRNEQDFRFILDLESSEFYGPSGGRRTLSKRPGVLRPKLSFDTGLFFAARLTHCSYRRQDLFGTPSSRVPMGRIASHLGVHTLLGAGDYVDVNLPGAYSSRLTSQKKYEIFFGNICDRDDCVDPTSADPHAQNDFHFFHDTFIREQNDPLLYIITDPPCIEPTSMPLTTGPNPGLTVGIKEGSDRAPCASAGYGSAGGLP
jgi:hypothetical protein